MRIIFFLLFFVTLAHGQNHDEIQQNAATYRKAQHKGHEKWDLGNKEKQRNNYKNQRRAAALIVLGMWPVFFLKKLLK